MEESTLGPLMDPDSPEYKAYHRKIRNKRTAGLVATFLTPILIILGFIARKKVTAVKKTVVSAIKKVTKSEDKYKAKLAQLKEQYQMWLSKVSGQEENLEEVLKLVRPDIKASGLGMSKVQAQIKRLEADISILKKVFKRNLKMEKAIMEKAQKALDPMSVKSLSKAIQKAQKLYEKEQSMNE